MNINKLSCYILFLILLSNNLYASSGNLGEELNLYAVLPFLGLLFSIAIMPLVCPIFWHHNYGKVSAFWSMLFLLPFSLHYGIHLSLYYLSTG